MSEKLTLVVTNTEVNDKIIASIRPLASEVSPSPDFRRRMKTRLLELRSTTSAGARAA